MFSSNVARKGNTILLLYADTTFTSVTVNDNTASAESSGIFISFSTVTIASSTFKTDTLPGSVATLKDASLANSNSGLFISISAGATVTVTGSSFKNGYGVSGGFVYMAGNSKLTFTTCTFDSSYVNTDGGAIYASGFDEIVISGSSFTSSSALKDGSVLYLSSGKTTISNTVLTVTPNPSAIYLVGGTFKGTSVTIANSQTTNTVIQENVNGGGIFASNMDSFIATS